MLLHLVIQWMSLGFYWLILFDFSCIVGACMLTGLIRIRLYGRQHSHAIPSFNHMREALPAAWHQNRPTAPPARSSNSVNTELLHFILEKKKITSTTCNVKKWFSPTIPHTCLRLLTPAQDNMMSVSKCQKSHWRICKSNQHGSLCFSSCLAFCE